MLRALRRLQPIPGELDEATRRCPWAGLRFAAGQLSDETFDWAIDQDPIVAIEEPACRVRMTDGQLNRVAPAAALYVMRCGQVDRTLVDRLMLNVLEECVRRQPQEAIWCGPAIERLPDATFAWLWSNADDLGRSSPPAQQRAARRLA